jgi:hypothetical protein
LLYF